MRVNGPYRLQKSQYMAFKTSINSYPKMSMNGPYSLQKSQYMAFKTSITHTLK